MDTKTIIENLPTTFYRVSIKALVLNEDQKKFLVVLEDNGYWELPGGGLDFPETPEEGLRREIKEEMGLIVTEVAKRPSYVLIGENMKGVKSINIVYEVKVKDLNFTPSDECVELKFISPNEIDTINAFRNVKELAVLMGAEK
jgi:8-oxo-dGTP pyrophosphatase MutT (NUDIX family)